MISRFLFHLQSANKRAEGKSTVELDQTGSLAFERVVGSVGSSISPEDYAGAVFDEDIDAEGVREEQAGHGAGSDTEGEALQAEISAARTPPHRWCQWPKQEIKTLQIVSSVRMYG